MKLATGLAAGGLDPFSGVGHMLSHPFIVRALLSGGVVAAACGLIGYFLVLRAQVFAGDALSHVAFTGALAALAAGIDLRVGLFAACIAFACAIGLLDTRERSDDVLIGNLFAWVLGLGALLLTVYASRSGAGRTGVTVLFGSVFGISPSQALVTALTGVGVIAVALLIARPLLFASLDEAAAAAAGVPARLIGLIFIVLVGVTAGEATQVVGSLLVLGLLAGPAATAHLLAGDPWRGVVVSVTSAVLSMWLGVAFAYLAPRLPVSFCVLAVSTAGYLAAALWRRVPRPTAADRVGGSRSFGSRRGRAVRGPA